jgi:hypothetical protein
MVLRRSIVVLLWFVGVGMVSASLWMIYPPLGLLAVGLAVLAESWGLAPRGEVR